MPCRVVGLPRSGDGLGLVVWKDLERFACRWSVVGASILFAVSIILLGLKISNPGSVQIFIEGREAEVKHSLDIYTQIDLQWVIFLSALAGGDADWLVVFLGGGTERYLYGNTITV